MKGLFPITFARVLVAVLVGVIVFLVVWAVGSVLKTNHADLGVKLEDWSGLLGLLVGLVTYFTNPNPSNPVA